MSSKPSGLCSGVVCGPPTPPRSSPPHAARRSCFLGALVCGHQQTFDLLNPAALFLWSCAAPVRTRGELWAPQRDSAFGPLWQTLMAFAPPWLQAITRFCLVLVVPRIVWVLVTTAVPVRCELAGWLGQKKADQTRFRSLLLRPPPRIWYRNVEHTRSIVMGQLKQRCYRVRLLTHIQRISQLRHFCLCVETVARSRWTFTLIFAGGPK